MKVALIPSAATDWAGQGRLLGRVELEPSSAAGNQLAAWSDELKATHIKRIYYAPDALSRTTARQLGSALGITVKELDALEEVDLGLWAGLTEEDLKKRYASAHRQLVDSPLAVSPPGGEEFSVAISRLRACFKKRLKANEEGGVGLVLRPFCFAMARYLLEGEGVKIWEASRAPAHPVVLELPALPAASGEGKDHQHD